MLTSLRVPIVAAPMAGGPSTPELVAAVSGAGGLGMLPGGGVTADALGERIERTRQLVGEPFGVNLFVPGSQSTIDMSGYTERVRAEAERLGVEPGEPRWDDDGYPLKIDLVIDERIPVVSFTFGPPAPDVVARLHEVGSEVMVTVTNPTEAALAAASGADALCVQGIEAGGHRGLFADDVTDSAGGPGYGLLAALRLVAAEVELPLVAAGGLVHGADIAAVLTAGACAAQLGTALLRCPEAGTAEAHRAALEAGERTTVITRAFSGRPARGLRNRFLDQHTDHAPAAFPQVHHMTGPVRAAGDPEAMSLWAGQTYPLATAEPAAELVARLDRETRDALSRLQERLHPSASRAR